jgi:hypothetical protein
MSNKSTQTRPPEYGAATGSAREQEQIAKIAEAKKGHYIRMRCWTEANHSSAETAAKSITAAVRFIRLHGPFHANWSIEFRSEPNVIMDH